MQRCTKEPAVSFTPTLRLFFRRAFHFLLPCRLLRGIKPSCALLKQLSLDEIYSPVISAVSQGNVAGFFAECTRIQPLTLMIGTSQCWENVYFLVLRNLLKRLYTMCGMHSRLSFSLVRVALSISDRGAESDPEGILCSLISRGILKGYLSHERQTAVLSQTDAFPLDFYLAVN